MKNITTYVGVNAHKKDLFIAMLVGDQIPSSNSNSDAIRSSPQERFAAATSAINRCWSVSIRGRP